MNEITKAPQSHPLVRRHEVVFDEDNLQAIKDFIAINLNSDNPKMQARAQELYFRILELAVKSATEPTELKNQFGVQIIIKKAEDENG